MRKKGELEKWQRAGGGGWRSRSLTLAVATEATRVASVSRFELERETSTLESSPASWLRLYARACVRALDTFSPNSC